MRLFCEEEITMAQNKRTSKKAVAKVQEKVAKAIPEAKKVVEEKVIPEAKKVVEEKVIPETKKVVETVKKAVPKKEMEIKLVVEYQGRQVEEKDMAAAVKTAWTESGNKEEDIKTMALYVKPEENTVYYVINDTETGKVAF